MPKPVAVYDKPESRSKGERLISVTGAPSFRRLIDLEISKTT
jgi:hypothetical protein